MHGHMNVKKKMEKSTKVYNFKCYTPSSEPYRMEYCYLKFNVDIAYFGQLNCSATQECSVNLITSL
jgi:hypothetical protein